MIMRLILFSLVLTVTISCRDDGSKCPGDILLPINISPYKSYYTLGDTIIIRSIFHKLIFDEKTDKLYDASKYNFRPAISFLSLDNTTESNVLSQVNQYSYFIENESSKMNVFYPGNESAIVGDYSLENDSLYFVIKLKLRKSGYFWIKTESITSGDSHLQNNYQFNCKGREINFTLDFPIESTIHLMQKFRLIKSNDWILSDSINRFYNYAGYCFEVR